MQKFIFWGCLIVCFTNAANAKKDDSNSASSHSSSIMCSPIDKLVIYLQDLGNRSINFSNEVSFVTAHPVFMANIMNQLIPHIGHNRPMNDWYRVAHILLRGLVPELYGSNVLGH